jgi:hypothetical protein
MKRRKGVGDDGWPSPAEARRSWGKDSFLPPKRSVRLAKLERTYQGIEARAALAAWPEADAEGASMFFVSAGALAEAVSSTCW